MERQYSRFFRLPTARKDLIVLGLLPPETADKVSFVGSASRSGTEILLENKKLRSGLNQEEIKMVDVVDLAGTPGFEKVFVDMMRF